jgi:plastocyanin
MTLAATVAISGCSDNEQYRYALDNTVQVRLSEYKILPRRIIVNAGDISLFAQNDGRLTHNLVIEEEQPEIGAEAVRYGRTPTLHPSELGTEVYPFKLKPGTYRMVCTVANHENLGMYGELKVIEAGEDPRNR